LINGNWGKDEKLTYFGVNPIPKKEGKTTWFRFGIKTEK